MARTSFYLSVKSNDITICSHIIANQTVELDNGISFSLAKKSGVYSLSLISKSDIVVTEIRVKLPIAQRLYNEHLYFYHDANDTNAQTKILQHCKNTGGRSGQVTVYKNVKSNGVFGVGLLTSKRFDTLIEHGEKQVSLIIDMENKRLEQGVTYTFDPFILQKSKEGTNDFLERYAKLVKKFNDVTLPTTIPVGFCSWSRYYGNINEQIIINQIKTTKEHLKNKGANVIQLDDGWQVFGTFAGKYQVDSKKFPNGLQPLVKLAKSKNLNLGLWLAPFVVNKNSPYFEQLKHMVDLSHKVSCLGEDIYSFDFDNPQYYEFLKEQFTYYRNLGITYYKLDFLVHTFRHGPFKSDYKIALYRKAIQVIKQAVGDATLVGCGGYVLPQIGIFPINRITCDIIWGASPEFPPHYQIIQDVSKTVSYRWFYNGKAQINDPDGVVVRDYDVGDGFKTTFNEAKLIATMIATSGGSVLHNEELNNISEDRKQLFLRLLPSLKESAKPLDFFEEDAPTTVYINRLKYKKPYVLVGCFNYGEQKEITIDTRRFGLDKAIVIRVWDNQFLGSLTVINQPIGEHCGELYLLIPIPTTPSFLYSDLCVSGGREQFYLKQSGANYTLTSNKKAYEKYHKYCFIPNGNNTFGKIVKTINEGFIVQVD